MKFRKLKANEIECRIGSSNKTKTGFSILLYKDARCDMNILDESDVIWQREHSRDNQNCTVSIWNNDIKQWIKREDTGTESFTEKEKGLASDSFKRACFNWGIGRELYTAPFIWIKTDNYEKDKYSKFKVDFISYDESGVINGLSISKQFGGEIYRFGTITFEPKNTPQKKAKKEITREDIKKMIDACKTVKDLSDLKTKEPTWLGEMEIANYAMIKYNEIK